ncbi:MAG: DNA-directed RNA polymerase subunit omega [candidate division WOR-3 bacterium]
MKFITIEEIWKKFPNKYEALIRAAKKVRQLVEAAEKNEIQLNENPYRYALRAIIEEKANEQ